MYWPQTSEQLHSHTSNITIVEYCHACAFRVNVSSFTPRNTDLWHYDTPQCPHPQVLPPLTTVTRTSHLCSTGMISTSSSIVYNLPLLSVWEKTVLFLALLTSAQFCLFNWFALYLPCALCHFTLSISFYCLFLFLFLQCLHLYICIVCMYIWLNCIYLYLNVYCQCLMLTVCTKGLRVTQFQFSVCMYCTCGRIYNKAKLDLIYAMFLHS